MDANEILEEAKSSFDDGVWYAAYSSYQQLLASSSPTRKLQGLVGLQATLDADYDPYAMLGIFANILLLLGLVVGASLIVWGIVIIDARGGGWMLAWPIMLQGVYAAVAGILGYFLLASAGKGLRLLLELRIAARISALLAMSATHKQG